MNRNGGSLVYFGVIFPESPGLTWAEAARIMLFGIAPEHPCPAILQIMITRGRPGLIERSRGYVYCPGHHRGAKKRLESWMQVGIGAWILLGVAAAAVAALVVAVLLRRSASPRRAKAHEPDAPGSLLSHGRIEVLERTDIDGERSLVLVRCDKIEHLILVGGPADVVVENDVKKVRGPGVPFPAITDQRTAPGAQPEAARYEPPAAPARRAEPASASLNNVAERAEPPALTGNGRAAEGGRGQRQHAGDTHSGRRDGGLPARRAMQPAPLGGRSEHGAEATATRGRANGGQSEDSPALPSAAVPWAEQDSIENEIVRALRVDPVPRGRENGPAPQPPAPPKKPADSSTTLGDLAERLEEALAQEVQSTRHTRRPEPEPDEFEFENNDDDELPPPPASLQPRPLEPRSRPIEPQARPAQQHARPVEQHARTAEPHPRPVAPHPPTQIEQNHRPSEHPARPVEQQQSRPLRRDVSPQMAEPPAQPPEPERRREPPAASERRREQPATPERREEAPVISLNARRREAVDPLEDEMARLLGELTGDKGR